MDDNITLSGPITVTFDPPQVQAVLHALNDLPYKFAQPIIQRIVDAARAAQAEAVQAEATPAETPPA